MTKLKSAEDWLLTESNLLPDKSNFEQSLKSLIMAVQQNAIEAALEVAAKETTKFEYNTPIISPTTLQNKRKILSLINHKDLKL